jgi:hypothetical protein
MTTKEYSMRSKKTDENTGDQTGAGKIGTPTRDLHHAAQLSAYCRAEARGFLPGHDLDDWLAAEAGANSAEEARHA